MKTLYVIRHAKSSWDDPYLDDFDRPLNKRGKKDAPKMGFLLKDRQIFPDLIISSAAKRAHSTAKKIANVIGFPKDEFQTTHSLYLAEAPSILSAVKHLDDEFDCVFIVGHNPGLTEFVNVFANSVSIDNIPTCGIVAMSVPEDSWQTVKEGSATLLFFEYPKKLDARS